MPIPMPDLRRVADALDEVRGATVSEIAIRPDLRQLRLALGDRGILVIGAGVDEEGRGRLEVDVVHPVDDAGRQLEVPFEGGVAPGRGGRA